MQKPICKQLKKLLINLQEAAEQFDRSFVEIKSRDLSEARMLRKKITDMMETISEHVSRHLMVINEKGEVVEYDLEKIRRHWFNFYSAAGLSRAALEVVKADLKLGAEQRKLIRKLAREGFNNFILMPSSPHLDLGKLNETMTSPIKELDEDEQYSVKKPLTDDEMQFYNHGQDHHRTEGKPYLLFMPDQRNATADPMDVSFDESLEKSREKYLNTCVGMTLPEYLIFQRDYTKRHAATNALTPHPSDQAYEWLTGTKSKLNDSIPFVRWSVGANRIKIITDSEQYKNKESIVKGHRDVAVFYLNKLDL